MTIAEVESILDKFFDARSVEVDNLISSLIGFNFDTVTVDDSTEPDLECALALDDILGDFFTGYKRTNTIWLVHELLRRLKAKKAKKRIKPRSVE